MDVIVSGAFAAGMLMAIGTVSATAVPTPGGQPAKPTADTAMFQLVKCKVPRSGSRTDNGCVVKPGGSATFQQDQNRNSGRSTGNSSSTRSSSSQSPMGSGGGMDGGPGPMNN